MIKRWSGSLVKIVKLVPLSSLWLLWFKLSLYFRNALKLVNRWTFSSSWHEWIMRKKSLIWWFAITDFKITLVKMVHVTGFIILVILCKLKPQKNHNNHTISYNSFTISYILIQSRTISYSFKLSHILLYLLFVEFVVSFV